MMSSYVNSYSPIHSVWHILHHMSNVEFKKKKFSSRTIWRIWEWMKQIHVVEILMRCSMVRCDWTCVCILDIFDIWHALENSAKKNFFVQTPENNYTKQFIYILSGFPQCWIQGKNNGRKSQGILFWAKIQGIFLFYAKVRVFFSRIAHVALSTCQICEYGTLLYHESMTVN